MLTFYGQTRALFVAKTSERLCLVAQENVAAFQGPGQGRTDRVGAELSDGTFGSG
jgi:hypothetical protein